MFVFSNLITALATILDSVLFIYMIVVFGAVIISWVGANPYNPIVRFLRQATDPLFYFLRRKMPFLVVGMVDFTPFVVILILIFLRQFVVVTLIELAVRLKG